MANAAGTQLPFEGGNNFRELGGYPAAGGRPVRRGVIYRGIPTANLTSAADRALLDSLGLRFILDLRSTAEAAAQPDYVPAGARLVQLCGLCAADGHEIAFSPKDIELLLSGEPEGEDDTRFMHAMYRGMLFGNKAFRELFRALEAGETPILFHCSAGKDRTGVAAMLILLALGADDETICADYALTNVCRKPEIDALLAEHADEIAADPAREDFYRGMAGVMPQTARFVLSCLREKYGSAAGYLEAEFSLDTARLERLRGLYLEG